MSKYFNQSRRQSLDGSMTDREIEQVEFRRDLEDVTKSYVVTEERPVPRLGECRKILLPKTEASHLIFSQVDIPAVVLESYRALRTRLLRAQGVQGLRSVVLSSAVAGEGKTLTSINLAICCARLHDFRVLVVDSDLRTRGLTRILGDPGGPGLSDLLAGRAQYDEAILATDCPNLYAISAGTTPADASELYSGNRWKELISRCNGVFQLVLVDSPPVLPVADFEQIVSVCDGVLVVVRAQRTNREMLKKMAARIDLKKLVGVIFNGASSDQLKEYEIDYSTGYTGAPSSDANNGQTHTVELDGTETTE